MDASSDGVSQKDLLLIVTSSVINTREFLVQRPKFQLGWNSGTIASISTKKKKQRFAKRKNECKIHFPNRMTTKHKEFQ